MKLSIYEKQELLKIAAFANVNLEYAQRCAEKFIHEMSNSAIIMRRKQAISDLNLFAESAFV